MILALLLSTALLAQESHDHGGAAGGKVILLPRETELRLAVNALPKALRDSAAVLTLEGDGYVKARPARIHSRASPAGAEATSTRFASMKKERGRSCPPLWTTR